MPITHTNRKAVAGLLALGEPTDTTDYEPWAARLADHDQTFEVSETSKVYPSLSPTSATTGK
jgi:hypothetical protein